MVEYQAEPVAPVDSPLEIQRVDGEIVFIGPGSIAFSMTADAAAETCRRLLRVVDPDAGDRS